MRLILASGSPRRRHLLEEMGIRFEVSPADVVEWEESDADPRELVLHNCRLKAETAAECFRELPVLAADSTVTIDNTVLNKPADMDEARSMLRRLSGRTHTVFTGVCFIYHVRDIHEVRCVTSEVTFQTLDNARIDRYFEIVNPLDKAGAYGIQEGRELIIAGLQGSFTNVMGLPVETTLELLEKFALLDSLKLG